MSDLPPRYAPGWPGIPPRWTSSAKTGVGTALNQHSRVWFTLSHGILNEVYFPRVDQACTRDMGFIVTDGSAFFPRRNAIAVSKIGLLNPAFRPMNSLIPATAGATRSTKKF